MRAGDLRNRVEIHEKQRVENELGEAEYKYTKIKTIWANITPTKSSLKTGQVGTEYVESTHRIKIRLQSLPNLDNTHRFKYRDQIHEVVYFNYDYKYNEFLEVFTKVIIE